MRLRRWFAVLFIIFGVAVSSGQVATGTPPFGSFGGGPFDAVNLGNLNAHFTIPVLNKAGRGMPFAYNLGYDSSVWTPMTSSGTTQWRPATNWGWSGQTQVSAGYLTAAFTSPSACNGNGAEQIYSNWVYRDPYGITHAFTGTLWQFVGGGINGNCSGQNSLNVVAADGSGYTLIASWCSTTCVQTSVVSRNGTSYSPPLNSTTSGTVTDANGNQITVNGSGQFFDTLSSTTPVLTVAGSGTPTSPITFKYTAPSGASASYTMNYLQYTVATKFGFSTITEYGPLSPHNSYI
jgi:hypothetical protein